MENSVETLKITENKNQALNEVITYGDLNFLSFWVDNFNSKKIIL